MLKVERWMFDVLPPPHLSPQRRTKAAKKVLTEANEGNKKLNPLFPLV
jgi:hypothetical protein